MLSGCNLFESNSKHFRGKAINGNRQAAAQEARSASLYRSCNFRVLETLSVIILDAACGNRGVIRFIPGFFQQQHLLDGAERLAGVLGLIGRPPIPG